MEIKKRTTLHVMYCRLRKSSLLPWRTPFKWEEEFCVSSIKEGIEKAKELLKEGDSHAYGFYFTQQEFVTIDGKEFYRKPCRLKATCYVGKKITRADVPSLSAEDLECFGGSDCYSDADLFIKLREILIGEILSSPRKTVVACEDDGEVSCYIPWERNMIVIDFDKL